MTIRGAIDDECGSHVREGDEVTDTARPLPLWLSTLLAKWEDASVFEHDDMGNTQSAQAFDQCAADLRAAWLESHSTCLEREQLIDKLADSMDRDNATEFVDAVIRAACQFHQDATTTTSIDTTGATYINSGDVWARVLTEEEREALGLAAGARPR